MITYLLPSPALQREEAVCWPETSFASRTHAESVKQLEFGGGFSAGDKRPSLRIGLRCLLGVFGRPIAPLAPVEDSHGGRPVQLIPIQYSLALALENSVADLTLPHPSRQCRGGDIRLFAGGKEPR